MPDHRSSTEHGLVSAAPDPLETEERLRLATQAADIGWWDVDVVNDLLFWPPSVKAMFGLGPDASVSLADFFQGLHPDDRDRVTAAYVAAADPDRRALYDEEYRTIGREDGMVRWVTAKGRGMFSEDGRCIRMIGAAIDITARKLAEQRLARSQADLAEAAGTLEALLANAPIGFAFFNRARCYVRINEVLAQINGRSISDHIGRTVGEVAPDNAVIIDPMIERVFETGTAALGIEIDGQTTARPGERRSWLTGFFPVLNAAAETLYVGAAVIDITARRRAEAAVREANDVLDQRVRARTSELAESERRFRAIFDTTFQVTGLATLSGDIIVVNRAWLDTIGASQAQLVGRKLWDADWWRDLPAEIARARAGVERVAGGAFVRYESQYRLPVGLRTFDFSLKPVLDEAGAPAFLVAEGRDITEIKQAEEHLRQAQKIEAIGQLTGGVAHDFNNLLMVISGGLSLLGKPQTPERHQRITDGMRQAAVRGAALSRQLLTFSRRQPLHPRPIDLRRQIGGMGEILDRTLRGDVHVQTRFDEMLWPVIVDATELELVILNLCVNARDAMPQGGTITIAADNAPSLARPGRLTGDFVRLTVTDTGQGMTPEVTERVFEPFFTTKELGKGSGLGMAQVHGFAAQSGGMVTLQSAPGQGTTVTLLLPRSGAAPVEATDAAPGGAIALDTGLARKVLLVEDDVAVAAMVADMLSDLGCEVLRVSNATAAMGALSDGRRIDLVFSDIMMPGRIDGIGLAHMLRERAPSLPVLLTSGFADQGKRTPLPSGVQILAKPYDLTGLATALDEALRRP